MSDEVSKVIPEEQPQNPVSMVVNTSQLPIFPVAQAIHLSYNNAIVRLVNTLNLGAFQPIDHFLFRIHVKNTLTNETCVIVQNGAEETEPAPIDFSTFISIAAILRLKDYDAAYVGGGVTIYLKEDDLATRFEHLFGEREEFGLYDLLCLGDDDNVDVSEEAQNAEEEEKAQLPPAA